MASLLIHNEFLRRTTELHDKKRRIPGPKAGIHSEHNLHFYGVCFVSGGLSSSIRWVLAPLELVKMRMQVAQTSISAVAMVRQVVRQDGVAGLFCGWGPTAVAYGLQTSTKYGLYEVLKDKYTRLAVDMTGQSEEYVHQNYKGLIYATAAGTAEACADVLMCPAEMLKVKIQTAENTRLSTSAALRTMLLNHQHYRFPFGALVPLWCRQVPATITNFYVFENAASAIYQYGLQRPKHDVTPSQQLGVTVCAGYIAGFSATVISHPADMLVSLMPRHPGQSAWQIARQVGLYNLATRGLAPRVMVTAKVICFQWLLYDSFKSLMGLGTSGGD